MGRGARGVASSGRGLEPLPLIAFPDNPPPPAQARLWVEVPNVLQPRDLLYQLSYGPVVDPAGLEPATRSLLAITLNIRLGAVGVVGRA